jgi:dihydroorotate dehydrogenase (fumarate)
MTGSTDLSTMYLGFRLPHPFIVGASPPVDHLDTVRRLEDAGCAAIVMHSLFEEQITAARSGRIHHLDPLDQQFATVLSYFPEPERYALGPDAYLEQLRRIKNAVKVPVVASLNGTSAETWLTFAQQIEQAGADALELNMSEVITDPKQSGASVEHSLTQVVQELKRALKIPLAVKLSPFFTAFGNVAHELDRAGADG